MKYTTFADMPTDVLEAVIELLDKKYPPPEFRAALQPDKIAEINFACGQRSVVEDLIAARRQREKT